MTTAGPPPVLVHRRRSPFVLGTVAVLVAVWLGFAAPSVSPVTPASAVPAANATTGAGDQAAPAPDGSRPRRGR
jgi:hypothetical protein